MPNSDGPRAAILGARNYFAMAGAFSLAINVLYLASPLYMLQVYDRVISSGSTVTLVMLTLILLLALATLAALDSIRTRILARAGIRLDRLLAGRVVAASVSQPGTRNVLRDFDSFRQVVTGTGMHAVFDLPWVPIYILVIFLLQPALGWFAAASSVLLMGLVFANEGLVARPLKEAGAAATRTYNFTEMTLRNAEVLQAMGMLDGMLERWSRRRNQFLDRQITAANRAATMTSLIRFMRLAMQSLVLGLGAYLAIEKLATVGVLFAASFLLGRALQPVEQIVVSWRSLVSARAAYGRVRDQLAAIPKTDVAMALPRPSGALSVEALTFALSNTPRFALRTVSFRLEPGDSLGIVGPSGAGKSTLARQIVGVLRPTSGVVRLDGADVWTWPRHLLGQYVGYLPQDIELFADTVAANIGRLRSGVDAEIVAAARLAGVHEMILRLPDGYNTQIGEGGSVLSGGYRQRIALARAVFGVPSLVVLDEPSSNLDSDGDSALNECLTQLRRLKTTVIVVSHRPSTLGSVNKILLLQDGAVELFGTREELALVLKQQAPSSVVVSAATQAGG